MWNSVQCEFSGMEQRAKVMALDAAVTSPPVFSLRHVHSSQSPSQRNRSMLAGMNFLFLTGRDYRSGSLLLAFLRVSRMSMHCLGLTGP